jgi:cysteine-rich repeat protein
VAGAVTGVCGDGIVNGTETCDDGNTLSCGTCNSLCNVTQALAAATGSIVTGGRTTLTDGEVFVLDDGVNPPTTFEFDNTGAVGAGRVLVDISNAVGGTANNEATTIAAAITSVSATLKITATVVMGTGQITLTNTTQGSVGNQPIFENVAAGSFVVTGMSGGGGKDCPLMTGCTSNNDCASGSCQFVSGMSGPKSCQ